ncbi:MAG: secretin and TonB N-terminal domain-containing protein [Burkholderiales bacterium]
MKIQSVKAAVRAVTCLLLLTLLLQGCATSRNSGPSPSENFVAGQQALAQGRIEEGIALIEQAARDDPRRIEYQVYLANQREAISAGLAREADRYRAAGDYATAEAVYQQILRIDPGSQRARNGLAQIPIDQRHDLLIAQAEAAVAKGDNVAADGLMRQVLQENPKNERGRALARRIEEWGAASTGTSPRLKRAFNKPITLEFRDADLSAVFEVMSRVAGINFVLDREVQGDAKVNIFVRNTPIEDVLKVLLITNQLEHKILNDNSVLVFPSTPAKQREYQDLVVRSFYLGNADAKQTQAMLKAVIKAKDIYIDEKLNMLVLRDTPEAVRVAERLVAAQDLAEPEVVLDLEVLEVQRTKLQELGFVYPTEIKLGQGLGNPTATIPSVIQLGKGGLQAFIANPAITAKIRQDLGNANLLANPRVRVRNREKAKVLIGQKLPVFTTTSTANVGVSTNVSYLDVGLKLEIESQVYLDDEVAMKVNLEVSNVISQVSSGGTQPATAYVIGTRNTATVLRLKDGETQALAGLIQDEDRRSFNNVPGLADFPVIGRLFSNQRIDAQKTEIVLLITPRVVRNVERPPSLVSEFAAGTEAAASTIPLRIKPTAAGALSLVPSTQSGGAVAGGEAQPPPPGRGDASAEAPLAGATAVLVQLQGPAQAALGNDFAVSVALPTGPDVRRAQMEIAYDPGLIELAEGGGTEAGAQGGGNRGPVVSSTPGRAVVRLNAPEGGQSAEGRVRFRVIAKSPAATQLTLENVVIQDARGRAVPGQSAGPLSLTLVQ